VNHPPYYLPAHSRITEPELLFHPIRSQDRHVHPLQGLLQFGPYSRSLVQGVFDPIRVATIFPQCERNQIESVLRELNTSHVPRERRAYLPAFPGFSQVFGIRLVSADEPAHLAIPDEIDRRLATEDRPHVYLAETLSRAIGRLESVRHNFDVLFILLPSRWEVGFEERDGEDFDLHDFLKALSASRGIPSQILREDKALSYPDRASVVWRLSIAVYCKAGGIPWKLADVDDDTAFIGISYAMRPEAQPRGQFVTCCSQVFNADGTGLEFIAYNASEVSVERENPYLSRSEMRRVMARSLRLYQRRHGGRTPKRVVIHKTTPFKAREADGCFDAFQGVHNIELYHIQQDVFWHAVQIEPSERLGVPSRYPCQRGTYLAIGPREALLWTAGNAPEAVGGKNYYKEGKGIPHPIALTRFAGHGGWHTPCTDVLGLTKMNWNNDSLYDRLPVTISYAQYLARIVKRVPSLSPSPYQVRFFI